MKQVTPPSNCPTKFKLCNKIIKIPKYTCLIIFDQFVFPCYFKAKPHSLLVGFNFQTFVLDFNRAYLNSAIKIINN